MIEVAPPIYDLLGKYKPILTTPGLKFSQNGFDQQQARKIQQFVINNYPSQAKELINGNALASKGISMNPTSRTIWNDIFTKIKKEEDKFSLKKQQEDKKKQQQTKVDNKSAQLIFKDPTGLTSAAQILFQPKAGAYKGLFPVLGTMPKNQQIAKLTNKQMINKIQQNRFLPSNSNYITSIFLDTTKATRKNEKMTTYFQKLQKQLTNQNAPNFKKLQQLKEASWDGKKWQIKNAPLNRKINKDYSKIFNENLNTANVLMEKQLNETQINQYIPSVIKSIVTANSDFSVAGIGPISKNSLPFYAGRFIDRATGRIRILPKASAKYLNPFSYEAKLNYLEARLINKWNQFVQVQSQYWRHQNLQKDYAKKRGQALIKGITQYQKIYPKALAFYKQQYYAYQSYLPISDSSAIVFSNMTQQQLSKFASFLNPPQASIKDNVQQISKLCSQVGTRIIDGMPFNSPRQIMQRAKVSNAFATFIQKATIRTKNMMLKLAKGFIPDVITQQNIQKIQKGSQAIKSYANKIGVQINQQALKKLYDGFTLGKTTQTFERGISALNQLLLKSNGGVTPFAQKYRMPPKTKVIKKQRQLDKLGRMIYKI